MLPSMGQVLLMLLIIVQAVNAPSRKTLYILFSTPESWNDAYATCRTEGYGLLKETDPLTSLVIANFKNNAEWENYLSGSDSWIGLHKSSPDNSGIYAWYDCQKLSSHNQWENGEEDNTDQLCVSSTSSGKWHTAPCSKSLPFICVRDGGPCRFTSYLETKYDATNTIMKVETGVDVISCQQTCLDIQEGNLECWALSYSRTESSCFLYLGTDPRKFLLSSSLKRDVNFDFHVKDCFKAYVKTNRPRLSNSADVPVKGCWRTLAADDEISYAGNMFTSLTPLPVSSETTISGVGATQFSAATQVSIKPSSRVSFEVSDTNSIPLQFMTTSASHQTVSPESANSHMDIIDSSVGDIDIQIYPHTSITATISEDFSDISFDHFETQSSSSTDSTHHLSASFISTMGWRSSATLPNTFSLSVSNNLISTSDVISSKENDVEIGSDLETSISSSFDTPAVVQASASIKRDASSDVITSLDAHLNSIPEDISASFSDVSVPVVIATGSLGKLEPSQSVYDEMSSCPCPCGRSPDTPLTSQEVHYIVKKTVSEIKVDKHNLSSTQRKYSSMTDHRQSAKNIGSIGIFTLCFVFGGIAAWDFVSLVKNAWNTVLKIVRKMRKPSLKEKRQIRAQRIFEASLKTPHLQLKTIYDTNC